MGKFGKKNTVDLNPLHYNIGLLGESGIGKTTLMKEVCETLAPEKNGEPGYLHLDIGREDGADAIEGIFSEKVEDWNKFSDIIDDIVTNKTTDYPNLQTVIIDTYDQLLELTEAQVIKMHNRENPDKPKITSINSAYGGFGHGLDKVIDVLFDKLWELKEVNVHFIIICHTKSKDIEDPVTGETYQILTSNTSQRYFNAIKTKLHFLGVAFIDRNIAKEKSGSREINKVVGETRVISFRDDNFSVDSKSRFANIVDRIPLDKDAFIKALTDAIKSESLKSGKTEKELKSEQTKRDKAAEKKAQEYEAEKLREANDMTAREEYIALIRSKFNDLDTEKKTAIKSILAKYGMKALNSEAPTEALREVAEYIENN